MTDYTRDLNHMYDCATRILAHPGALVDDDGESIYDSMVAFLGDPHIGDEFEFRWPTTPLRDSRGRFV